MWKKIGLLALVFGLVFGMSYAFSREVVYKLWKKLKGK